MGHAYRAVGWNRQKRLYDSWMVVGILGYVALFVGAGFAVHPGATAETLIIRAFGTLAFLMLHVVLSIGPLCRLDRRFLPLLYNRRHLGVATFLVGLVHGGFVLFQYHALGDVDPLTSLLISNRRFDSVSQFPFELFGALALAILFIMAATSHDFWLANLTAPVWKALHMSVYVAWGLLVLHVATGVLQAETSLVWSGAVGLGVAWILGLHLVAGWRERALDRELDPGTDGWVDAGEVASIPEGRARIVTVAGDRVAVFRYDGKVSAVSNACQHQNGPLGEGCVRDGKIVCPWHGYEYFPASGSSPEPFTERVPTFRVQVREGRVWVHPQPLAPGTEVEPASCSEEGHRD